jgi:hypothetical protein
MARVWAEPREDWNASFRVEVTADYLVAVRELEARLEEAMILKGRGRLRRENPTPEG